nr:RNA-dependent RNA polymerase [Dipluran tombus-related virus]
MRLRKQAPVRNIFQHITRRASRPHSHARPGLARTCLGELGRTHGFSEWVARFDSPGKRAILRRSRERYERGDDMHAFSSVNVFLKREKLLEHGKAARLVSSRNDTLKCLLGPYIAAMEKVVYQSKWCCKGCNSYTKAQKFAELYGSFSDPVTIEADYSKFDAHVSEFFLKHIEHAFYTRMCRDPFLREMLRYQLTNFCRTKNGGRYIVRGTRMSGDVNTSLGNGIINYILWRTLFHRAGIRARILVDGDDSICVVERSDLAAALQAMETVGEYGFDIKYNVRLDRRDVSFCSGMFIRTNAGLRYIRAPCNLLRKAPYSVGTFTWLQARRRARLVSYCEYLCHDNIPVLGALAMFWRRAAGSGALDQTDQRYLYRIEVESSAQRSQTIGAESRDDFYHITGLSPRRQRWLEANLNACSGGIDSALPPRVALYLARCVDWNSWYVD